MDKLVAEQKKTRVWQKFLHETEKQLVTDKPNEQKRKKKQKTETKCLHHADPGGN